MHAVENQRGARKPFCLLISMCRKLRRPGQGLEIVALWIKRGEVQGAPRRLYCRIALALERVDCSAVEPTQRVAGVCIQGLVAALTGGVQVLQQMTVDEAFRSERKGIRRIPIKRGVAGTQRLGSLALAIR